MLAASTQFWKQASPRSRTCFRPLSVMTSPLGFTTTSLGMTEMWYLVLSSLRERRGRGKPGQQGTRRAARCTSEGTGASPRAGPADPAKPQPPACWHALLRAGLLYTCCPCCGPVLSQGSVRREGAALHLSCPNRQLRGTPERPKVLTGLRKRIFHLS